MSLEKYFNRSFEMIEFPYFVPKQELNYNLDYANKIETEKWIPNNWHQYFNMKGNGRFSTDVKRILSHGGLILEICVGPGGGFMPYILQEDYNVNIMISDLCPTVVREWKKLFDSMQNPPLNVEFAAFNVCDMPFIDNSIDVISGCAAIGNIEGDKRKALGEIYRVLKPGGLFVMKDICITNEFFNSMEPHLQKAFMEHWPDIFGDFQDVLEELGFNSIETVINGSWSNKDDDSNLADFTRSLGAELIFSGYTKYSIK